MSNERLPWFPCYPSKLLGALSAMKPTEGYVYWIVCLRIYEVNGPCADSLDALARRTGYNRRIVSDALDRLFRAGKLLRNESGITNPFAEDVLAESTALHKERVRSGREGGLRAAEKRKKNQPKTGSQAIGKEEPARTHLQVHLQEDSRVPRGTLAEGVDLFQKLPKTLSTDPEAEMYRRGKDVLGEKAGGLITKLYDHHNRNVALTRAAIERASQAQSPREFIGAMLRGRGAAKNGIAAAARRAVEQMREDDDERADDRAIEHHH